MIRSFGGYRRLSMAMVALWLVALPVLAFAQSTPTVQGLNVTGVTPGLVKIAPGTGALSPATSADITGALGFTPAQAGPTIYISFDAGGNACFTVNGVKSPPGANCTSTPTPITGTLVAPDGTICFKAGTTVYPASSECVGLFSALGGGNSNVAANGVPSPVVSMNATNQGVYVSVAPVAATPAINRYSFMCAGNSGTETPTPTLTGIQLSYFLGGLGAGQSEYCKATATNLTGDTSSTSSEVSATALTLPNTGTMAQLYPTLLAENGGANAATTVPAMPSGFIFADYSDTYPVVGFNAFSNWINLPNNYVSIHTGQASESDFANSVDGQLSTSQGHPRIVNVPLIWDNLPGNCTVAGANLAAASAGTYNSDYTTVANKLLTDMTNGVNGPAQSVIIVRTGWEFNNDNGASCPWYSGGGNQSNYIGAFRNLVTQFRAAAAAFTPPAGVTAPVFQFTWCWLLDGDAPTASYPGDSYVDYLGIDVYTQPGSSYDSADPDTEFNNMLSTANGLNFAVSFQAAHGNKPIVFPEVGNGAYGDNWGAFWKRMGLWIATGNSGAAENVKYLTVWNSNGGGYPGLCADGSRPETCGMLRHMFNPTTYPVEPLPWPNGISMSGGNGSVALTANATPSSAAATSYGAFCGATSGGENRATPVATASTPSFTITGANGTPVYCMVAIQNAAGNWGFLSPEASATPLAPPANTPAHYVTMASTGVVTSPLTSGITPTTNPCWEVTFSPANSDMTGNHPLFSVWGPNGYSQSFYFGLSNGQPLLILKDSSNNRPGWTAAGATLTVGGWFTFKSCLTSSTGVLQASWGPAGVADSALTALTPVSGSANFVPSTAAYDPGLSLSPAIVLGGMVGTGQEHFAGSVSAAYMTNNGTTVANPVAGASSVTDSTASGPTWTVASGATLH